MKTRIVILSTGQRMRVPTNIQRLEGRSLSGWQVRYHGTRYFADGQGTARASLRLATAELVKRIQQYPAPTRIKVDQQSSKRSAMPQGISGPVVRRRGGFYEASLLVSVPRFGKRARRGTVYLGTENTYTAQRYEAGIKKALAMRTKAVKLYQEHATSARRAST